MKNLISFRFPAHHAVRAAAACAVLAIFSHAVAAASWNRIEPLKSRRADVERVLGQPVAVRQGDDGALQFRVAGGTVTVTFVTAKFVANKKLSPELEGTVLEVVLQHENASDTPESIGLPGKSGFTRNDVRGGTIFSNLKDGITYTFFNGKLKTTRYAPSAGQLARARKGK